jgi:hypothetical protein
MDDIVKIKVELDKTQFGPAVKQAGQELGSLSKQTPDFFAPGLHLGCVGPV